VFAQDLITEQLPGRTLLADGKEYLYFSGTSYLGMAVNPAFQEYLQEGIKRYGTNYSSSRLSNVQLAVFEEAEHYLVNYTGTEAALTVSSGFLAGQLVVRTFAQDNSFLYGPRTHPALWLNTQNFNNYNFEEWAEQVPQLIYNSASPDIFILFNSLDPLLAKKYDVSWLSTLASTKNITCIIDDSHGFGVTGKNGAGISSELSLPEGSRKIVVSSLGKALGIPGGVILSDERTIRELRKSPFFGGGSPIIPAYLYAFLRAPSIYQRAREKLFANITYFKSLLNKPGLFQNFPDYPVFYTPYNQLYHFLLQQDILISSFSYPTPTDEPVTRVILNSLHAPGDMRQLATLINEFGASQHNMLLQS